MYFVLVLDAYHAVQYRIVEHRMIHQTEKVARGELKTTNELTALHDTLTRAVAMVDELLRAQTGTSKADPGLYRQFPGGPLNEAGVLEIERRFDAGQSDSEIALAMSISLGGVSRRRALWRRSKSR